MAMRKVLPVHKNQKHVCWKSASKLEIYAAKFPQGHFSKVEANSIEQGRQHET